MRRLPVGYAPLRQFAPRLQSSSNGFNRRLILIELANSAPAPFSVLRHQMPVSPAPQASKSPSIATVSMLPPSVQNSFPQRPDLPRGAENDDPHIFRAIERVSHRRAVVSPDVAVRIVTGLSPLICVSICAIKRVRRSSKASVGPWNSSVQPTRFHSRATGAGNAKRRADALFQNLLRYFIATNAERIFCATADKVPLSIHQFPSG